MPILFPTDLIHANVVGPNHNIDSAGFFLIIKEKTGPRVLCMGESSSLSISSNPDIDQDLIANYLELEESF